MLLKVKNLKVVFQKHIAVNNVTFSIEPGQTFSLVGKSGSGKTTVAKAVVGLIEPHCGELLLDGMPIPPLRWTQKSLWARKQIQMVFQDPYTSLNPTMTVGRAIAEPLYIHNMTQDIPKRVSELLEMVGLSPDAVNYTPQRFSGGQRQRIVIARALATNPKLLVCDEATTALDVSVQAQILNLLKTLQKQFNLSYLFITHNTDLAVYMGDSIGCMENGCLMVDGVD